MRNGKVYSDLLSIEAEKMLFKKGLNTFNVYEKEFTKAQKLEDFEDYAATRRTSATSDMLLKK
jgi:hypothetical protein